jgi:hypothetical protein
MQDNEGKTAAHVAAHWGYTHVIKLLLKADPPVDMGIKDKVPRSSMDVFIYMFRCLILASKMSY